MRCVNVVWRVCLAALGSWALLPANAYATPTLELGTYNLAPGTAGQTITISAYGGDSVQGLNFAVQTGDGGIYSFGSAAGNAPVITAVNIEPTANSIFNTSNANPQGPSSGPPQFGGADTISSAPNRNVSQLWLVTCTAKTTTNVGSGDTPGMDQVLAQLTIDTTGYSAGQTFTLTLTQTQDGPTNFAGIGANVTGPTTFQGDAAGLIVLTPEPTTFAMMLLGAPLLLQRRRKIG